MKTFSVAVAVAVMLTFICIQKSFAAVSEVQVQEEVMSNDSPVAAHEETSVESWMMPHNSRQKRRPKCRFCCGCCRRGVCGLCCKF
ncbi:hepcidin-like [Scomber scombrus]|uniref:Hepcidin-like n=1 Tax=Scomber scombrus TaxID=13677 RepID=A0AAV1N4Y7_SCOSC